MSETDNKPSKYEWGDEILDRVKYGAMNAQSPSYIAEQVGLTGDFRLHFLQDITNPKTTIGREYRHSLSISTKDVDSTIHFLQLAGDTDAMEIALKRKRLEYISRLKEDLFGL